MWLVIWKVYGPFPWVITSSNMLLGDWDDVKHDYLYGRMNDEKFFCIADVMKCKEYAVYMYIYLESHVGHRPHG